MDDDSHVRNWFKRRYKHSLQDRSAHTGLMQHNLHSPHARHFLSQSPSIGCGSSHQQSHDSSLAPFGHERSTMSEAQSIDVIDVLMAQLIQSFLSLGSRACLILDQPVGRKDLVSSDPQSSSCKDLADADDKDDKDDKAGNCFLSGFLNDFQAEILGLVCWAAFGWAWLMW